MKGEMVGVRQIVGLPLSFPGTPRIWPYHLGMHEIQLCECVPPFHAVLCTLCLAFTATPGRLQGLAHGHLW